MRGAWSGSRLPMVSEYRNFHLQNNTLQLTQFFLGGVPEGRRPIEGGVSTAVFIIAWLIFRLYAVRLKPPQAASCCRAGGGHSNPWIRRTRTVRRPILPTIANNTDHSTQSRMLCVPRGQRTRHPRQLRSPVCCFLVASYSPVDELCRCWSPHTS
jgi:hypothetical protein